MGWVIVAAVVPSQSCVHLFAAPWIVAHQAPLPLRISRQEHRNAISFSKGSFQTRDRTCVSCIGRQILYLPPGKPGLRYGQALKEILQKSECPRMQSGLFPVMGVIIST